SHHWGWVAASGAVAVVGYVTAIVMAVEKGSAQNSANAVAQSIVANGGGQGTCFVGPNSPTAYYANACNALNSDDNNVNADATVANVGLAIGLVGTAGLIVSTIFAATSYSSPSSDKPAQSGTNAPVTVVPILGKGFGGMSIGGTF
ncbi:MAG: hypothetical protein ACLQVI_14170, partial [Polyangiaceae bacterium]